MSCKHCMLSARRFSQPASQICFTCAHTQKRQGVIIEAGRGIITKSFIHSPGMLNLQIASADQVSSSAGSKVEHTDSGQKTSTSLLFSVLK